jgi:hypothetical protein
VFELTRNCIVLLADLFQRIDDFTNFPIEKLVFANRLEVFCNWMNYETCPEINNKKILIADVKDLNELSKYIEFASAFEFLYSEFVSS